MSSEAFLRFHQTLALEYCVPPDPDMCLVAVDTDRSGEVTLGEFDCWLLETFTQAQRNNQTLTVANMPLPQHNDFKPWPPPSKYGAPPPPPYLLEYRKLPIETYAMGYSEYQVAVKNLQTFCWIGIQEEYDESIRQLSVLVNLPKLTAVSANVGGGGTGDATPLELAAIRKYNFWDLKLYEYGLARFEQQKKSFPTRPYPN